MNDFPIIWSALTFALFALLHSLLASHRLKELLFTKWTKLSVWYRFTYNVIAVVTLGVWLLFIYILLPNPNQLIYKWEGIWLWVGYLLQLIGITGMVYSFRPIDTLSFLGVRQIIDYIVANKYPQQLDETRQQTLTHTGLYRCIRHPLYTSSLIALWAAPQVTYFWLTCAILFSIYFVVGSVFEEQRLLSQYPTYREYRSGTGRFLPSFDCIKHWLKES
ncbi:MAG: methyltransferase family protein [Bacteroidota bacterium]